MKKAPISLLALLSLMLTFALPAFAGDEKAPPEESKKETSKDDPKPKEKENESPLVKAARDAKAKREGEKSRISITNSDVKKSDGKLIQSSTKPLEPIPASSDVEKTMRDIDTAKKKNSNKAELEAVVEKRQKAVDDLEKELRRIEETYYNEDDPDYREDVLAKNFQETKDQLDAARKDLAAARKALASSGGK